MSVSEDESMCQRRVSSGVKLLKQLSASIGPVVMVKAKIKSLEIVSLNGRMKDTFIESIRHCQIYARKFFNQPAK